ncbi:hypothetical protein OU994_05070 [Pseudoduganella sp. SL102]|uniref:hypothetical protein n=1 Tax=Pseudoduganella sp. SL102 TaxID=2995154 RepID=UPI00248C1F8F|nr:hypothetical protein [Pseudoduganella sp. SL102]WBS03679.1 hypothetical protein OU994_05070 [Pseudoduganella sp. SL102]
MAEKRIFRQAALDRLASPEQLDHLVPVADAPGWIALSIGALLAMALLAWGLAGSLPITLAARGSLAADGHAVLRVPAAAAGTVRPGMDVLLRPAPWHAAPSWPPAARSHASPPHPAAHTMPPIPGLST